MRKDMPKLIVEVERAGSDLKSKKTRLVIRDFDLEAEYDFPNHLPSSRYRQYPMNYRTSGDKFNPIYGFLQSRLGQLWDKVYSEIRQAIYVRREIDRHFLNHVYDLLDRNCVLGSDGKIYEQQYSRRWIEVSGYYIHPVSKRLCFKPWPRFCDRYLFSTF